MAVANDAAAPAGGAAPERITQFAAKVPGTSAAGYDRASGLGVPRFDQLAAALPAPGGGG